MECRPGVLEINAIDFIKVMKKENDTECNRMAYTMALDHLLRGAMEGADNEPYMEATLYCYRMMKELIDEKYPETETE